MSSDHISEAIETARKYVAEHPDDARCAPQSSAYRFSALR
jgi:hypothetical protein